MAKTHDDEIVRGHNHCGLTASARHIIRVSWDRILASSIDPEKGTVDGALVGHPSMPSI
jgi:hypothetical protein